MTRSWALAPSTALALVLILRCASGFDRFDGPVTTLDPDLCSPDGEFTLESTNPYFPMTVGSRWVLEHDDERLEITVLDETDVVAGIETRVIEEREWEDGKLEEISRNFFAQADDGTICYFGEDVDIFEDGEVVSHEGAWRADAPGHSPGIFMPADPRPGMRFRTEIAPGKAEDEALIFDVGRTTVVPAGTFTRTIRILEVNPLEGDEEEFNIFAAGDGIILDEDLELVSH